MKPDNENSSPHEKIKHEMEELREKSSAAFKSLGAKTSDVASLFMKIVQDDQPKPLADGLFEIFETYGDFGDKYEQALRNQQVEIAAYRDGLAQIAVRHNEKLIRDYELLSSDDLGDQIEAAANIADAKQKIEEWRERTERVSRELVYISLYPLLTAPIAVNGAWAAALGDRQGAEKAKRVLLATAESIGANIPILPIFFKPILEIFRVTLARRADQLDRTMRAIEQLKNLYAVKEVLDQVDEDLKVSWTEIVTRAGVELDEFSNWYPPQ